MNHDSVNLILASQSPRRRQLLEEAGFQFTVMAPHDDVEKAASLELPPEQLVVESALLKARFVARQVPSGLILAADTVAVCGKEILGKPASRADARRMLLMLSGQQHSVLTAICLWHRPSDCFQTHLESTKLRMDELTHEELEAFLETGGWEGKAGAFGYQDDLDWVHIESGLASNVVGLPVERLAEWVEQLMATIRAVD